MRAILPTNLICHCLFKYSLACWKRLQNTQRHKVRGLNQNACQEILKDSKICFLLDSEICKDRGVWIGFDKAAEMIELC